MENIYNISIPFYKNKLPEIFENVLVVFIKHNDAYIEARLIEYNIDGIMTYDNATRRKKVYDWKKELPLNKETVATVEQIISSDYIQLSTLNLKKDDPELMKPFKNNKILVNIIKKLCQKFNIDFNDFWTKIIYNINISNVFDDQEEINKLILETFSESKEIILELNKLFNYKVNKIQKQIRLISNDINNTISLLNFIENKYDFLSPIKYQADSVYIIESLNNIDEVIDLIKTIAINYNVNFSDP
jgi:translation initiation factor 2 alpha subunit (eIF-2alpha)